MKTIYMTFAQLAPCSDANPNGLVAEIFYVVENGAVVITTEEGEPLRDVWGKALSKKLTDGEDARKVAANLGLRHSRATSIVEGNSVVLLDAESGVELADYELSDWQSPEDGALWLYMAMGEGASTDQAGAS